MDCGAECSNCWKQQPQQQRERTSTIELMSCVLSRAFLEWILMFLLYINAIFSFLVTQFARLCKLQTPCILCSRLDHVLLPGRVHKLDFYNDLICHSHKKKIADLTYIEKKNDSTFLSSSLPTSKHCPCCSVPLECKSPPPPQEPRTDKCIDADDDDDKRMIVKKTMENSNSDHQSEKHEERRLDKCIKPEPVSLTVPAVDAIVDSTPLDSETVSKGNLESMDDKCTVPLECKSLEPRIDKCMDDDDDNDDDERRIVKKTMENSDSDHQSENANQLSYNIDEKHKERRHDKCIKPEPVSLTVPATDTIVDSTPLDSETVSKENLESMDDKLTGSGNSTTRTSTSDPDAITSQTTRDTGSNIDLNDAYKLATGSKSSSIPSPTVTQVITGRDSSKVYEDLRLLVSQFSAARGLESPWAELSPSPRVLHDPSNASILEHITKSLSIDRNESGLESLDRSSSVISEVEGESVVDRLKRQIELDRKSMYLLYKELEEERNASAVAAYQAMAMITRLQEEKASMHMEALQYQRMMEEQSEYDQEAILKLNQLMLQREKEVQDLEVRLACFRKEVRDDFVLDRFEENDV